jgi:hypothetical protein
MATGRGQSRSKAPSQRYRVFLSHATADKWLARTLCEMIEKAGATTFRDDRDIAGGDDIPDKIWDAIADSNEMVVLLTPLSVTRPWVLMEIGAAALRRSEMRIIALRQHVDLDPIPEMLKRKKSLDLNDFDRYLEELHERVRALK